MTGMEHERILAGLISLNVINGTMTGSVVALYIYSIETDISLKNILMYLVVPSADNIKTLVFLNSKKWDACAI